MLVGLRDPHRPGAGPAMPPQPAKRESLRLNPGALLFKKYYVNLHNQKLNNL